MHAWRFMPEPPGQPDREPHGPRPVPDNYHRGPWRRAGCLLQPEGAQAHDEQVRIPAPVWMMSPDELTSAVLNITQ